MTARTFIRSWAASHVTLAEVARALRAALDADRGFDVLDEVDAAVVLAFTVALHPQGPAVVAQTPDGQHLATCADPLVAIAYAFSTIDRVAAAQHCPARRQRSARRPTTESQIP